MSQLGGLSPDLLLEQVVVSLDMSQEGRRRYLHDAHHG